MSIRTKMILVFSVVSAIILLAASFAGYFFTKARFADNIEKQMTATINANVNKLDGWLMTKAKVIEVTEGTIRAAGDGGDVPASLLMGYKSKDKDLSDVYFGSAEGKLVDSTGWVPPSDFDPRSRIWYKKAIEQKKLIFTDPYLDANTKQMAVSVALPHETASGQVRGVVSADILLQTLVENVRSISFEGHGYAFLLDNKGFILAHPNSELMAKNIFESEKLKDIALAIKDISGKEQGYKSFQDNGKDMIMVYKQIPSTQWTLCINVEEAVVFEPLAYLKWLFTGITLVSILIVIAVSTAVARRITKPLKNLEHQVGLLASGNLTIQAEVTGDDEISRLAAGFNKMVGDLRGMIQDLRRSTVEMQGSSANLIDISSNLAANSQEMSATVGLVSNSIEQISAGTEENASSAQQVSHSGQVVTKMAKEMAAAAKAAVKASEEVAAEVKEVSSVIADVSQSINQVAVFAQEVSASCQRSIAITNEAKSRSFETNDIIRKLSVSSKQITNIVNIIRNIAEQTNMLALNATIEAAGAGEAGRGFAVVAGEVKELSKRTAEEAAHIGEQIEAMQNDMSEAVAGVGKISEVINETIEITQTIALAVGEQAKSWQDTRDDVQAKNSKLTTISTEVAAIAGKSVHVSQNAEKAASGVQAMFQTTAEISQKAEEVAHSIQETEAALINISQATTEIAKGTQDISLTMQEADKAIADTATRASNVSECAHGMGELANHLQAMVEKFKV